MKTKNNFYSLRITIILCFTLLLALTSLYGINASQREDKNSNYIITQTKEGFLPSQLTIQKGDTVTFKNTAGKMFWPASNLHPTHSIYSEFDPKRSIKSNETWSFTFNKTGDWKFHDHLDPYYIGEIRVLDKKNTEIRQAYNEASCTRLTSTRSKQQCFENVIDSVLKRDGLTETFELMSRLYTSDPLFATECHSYSHKLGEKTYDLFSKNKTVALSDKSSYCGYGFYHGFMESLLHKTTNIKKAQEFCAYAGKALRAKTSDAEGACYHGIGHGIVADEPVRSAWGNAQKVIQPGLSLCEKVSNTPSKLFRCTSGAFNAYEVLATQKQYNLSHNENDPFAVCRNQPERYKLACYSQLSVVAIRASKNDFSRAVAFTDSIPEDPYAISAMTSIVVEKSRQKNTSNEEKITFCRNLKTRFQIPCIQALPEGLLKYGPPQKEYIKAVEFCSFSFLTPSEKNACFNKVLSILRNFYTVEKSQEICQSVEKDYQINNCNY